MHHMKIGHPPLSQSSDQKLMMMKGLVRFLALAVLALAAKPSSW